MLKREKSDFQQTFGPRLRSNSHYVCQPLSLICNVCLILHLVPSAVGTCPDSPPHCSFLVISYPLSLNSGLPSQSKCPVVPMMLQCRSSCKTLREFFSPLPWHLHTILEFLSAQILASYFCSYFLPFRKAICWLSMLVLQAIHSHYWVSNYVQ